MKREGFKMGQNLLALALPHKSCFISLSFPPLSCKTEIIIVPPSQGG